MNKTQPTCCAKDNRREFVNPNRVVITLRIEGVSVLPFCDAGQLHEHSSFDASGSAKALSGCFFYPRLKARAIEEFQEK